MFSGLTHKRVLKIEKWTNILTLYGLPGRGTRLPISQNYSNILKIIPRLLTQRSKSLLVIVKREIIHFGFMKHPLIAINRKIFLILKR